MVSKLLFISNNIFSLSSIIFFFVGHLAFDFSSDIVTSNNYLIDLLKKNVIKKTICHNKENLRL